MGLRDNLNLGLFFYIRDFELGLVLFFYGIILKWEVGVLKFVLCGF